MIYHLLNRKERLFAVLLLLLLMSERVVTRGTSFLADDTPSIGMAIPKLANVSKRILPTLAIFK